ncbi:hypothetical protein CLF_105829 [Clonorchis sinensis]|uniref:Uncharacterized protein n=1 Tax=Clonorchis sinensis TaxID=79923 RepID=G7YPG2_CLOSI|nr:hypothetical protein CLF_105829 [Clonorchis sinensis]
MLTSEYKHSIRRTHKPCQNTDLRIAYDQNAFVVHCGVPIVHLHPLELVIMSSQMSTLMATLRSLPLGCKPHFDADSGRPKRHAQLHARGYCQVPVSKQKDNYSPQSKHSVRNFDPKAALIYLTSRKSEKKFPTVNLVHTFGNELLSLNSNLQALKCDQVVIFKRGQFYKPDKFSRDMSDAYMNLKSGFDTLTQ